MAWRGMASEPTAIAHAPPGCVSSLQRVADHDDHGSGSGDGPQLVLPRPFTASGARTTRLVAVLVHWGEHLDRIVSDTYDRTNEEQACDLPSTYVALRTSRRVDDHANANANGDDNTGDHDDAPPSYELRSSPFATSRVVERSAHPVWSELLLVALPLDWQQQTDAGTWQLHVDVVRRDPSQQEDALLASVRLSLHRLAMHHTPYHVVVDLAPRSSSSSSSSSTEPAPRVYLSLSDADAMDDAGQVLEVVIDQVEDARTLEQTNTQHASAAAALVLTTSPLTPSFSLRDLFTSPTHNDSAAAAPPPANANCTWISPIAKPKRTDGMARPRQQWRFPTVFSCRTSEHPLGAIDQLHAYLLSVAPNNETRSPTFDCVGVAALTLAGVPAQGTATSVDVSLASPSGSGVSQPRGGVVLRTTVRHWDTQSWASFQRTSVSRRVITTNRRHRKRVALLALEWTGALCRGLNRYPISSFCDEGGLSGLLTSYLATTNSQNDDSGDGVAARPADSATANGTRQPDDLLNHHIRLLQQEVMVKQETIQTLQRDGEAAATALRTCGTELVVARKEVRARDEQIAQLQTKLREMEQRDADQTRELLAATGGLTGLRLDSQGTQRLNMLIFKYKELEQRHATTEAELVDAKRAVAAFNQLERKYSELEQAHVVQAGLVQRLQKDKAQHGELQRTVRLQEKVIRKLEKAVATHPPAALQPTDGTAVSPIDGTLLASAPHPVATGDLDSPLLAVRVQVLEQQLQANAKAAASEIARLKMRVMELETQLSCDGTDTDSVAPSRRPAR